MGTCPQYDVLECGARQPRVVAALAGSRRRGDRQHQLHQRPTALPHGGGLLGSQSRPQQSHQGLVGGVRPRGVRVNAVAPGPVRTPFWTAPGAFADTVAAGTGGTAREALDEVVPQQMGISTGRITEPQEVADLVVFLASPRAGNITGAEFVIDGGQIKTT